MNQEHVIIESIKVYEFLHVQKKNGIFNPVKFRLFTLKFTAE